MFSPAKEAPVPVAACQAPTAACTAAVVVIAPSRSQASVLVRITVCTARGISTKIWTYLSRPGSAVSRSVAVKVARTAASRIGIGSQARVGSLRRSASKVNAARPISATEARWAGRCPGAGVPGSGAAGAKDAPYRPNQDLDVGAEGPVVDVVVVEAGAVLDGGVAAEAVDLGPAGDADRDPVAEFVGRGRLGELLHEVGAFGAGADEAHVAPEDVPELGQFVEGGLAEDFSGGAEAQVVGDAPAGVRLLLADGFDGPQLEQRDPTAAQAHAVLPEEHPWAALPADRQRADGHDRHRHGQPDDRQRDVQRPLERPGQPGLGRRAHPQDGEAPDVLAERDEVHQDVAGLGGEVDLAAEAAGDPGEQSRLLAGAVRERDDHRPDAVGAEDRAELVGAAQERDPYIL